MAKFNKDFKTIPQSRPASGHPFGSWLPVRFTGIHAGNILDAPQLFQERLSMGQCQHRILPFLD